MRRWLFRFLLVVTLAGAALLVARRRGSAATEPSAPPSWPPFDDETPERATPPLVSSVPDEVPASERWIDPVERACPPGFEVKVKLASGIYHLPGMFAYQRTMPDRCYASAEAAEADGFRPAKR
jgi:hypothetical protein